MIVGTAGHIDHGKSSLVRALTGVDTDRLKEEKARGISIELGYAYLPAPDGQVLGFIDVPGHEKLVHTMVAGASGIDFGLLVIAADDGVMPQTREHLAILQLVGVTRGAVAITKIDCVDATRVAEVETQVLAMLAGTALADAPVFRVNAVATAAAAASASAGTQDTPHTPHTPHTPISADATLNAKASSAATLDRSGSSDDGVAALREHLFACAAALPARRQDGFFRLAVDRVFTLAGRGTVVTGTVFSGRLQLPATGNAAEEGDEAAQLVLAPAGTPVRVRSLHAQNRAASVGVAGQRCALNLAAIDTRSIERGDWIADERALLPSTRIDVDLRLLADADTTVKAWTPLHIHWGAARRLAHVVPLTTDAVAPGAQARVQLVFDKPICASAGDRFIARNAQATRTIGGGVILDPQAPDRKRRSAARLQWLDAIASMLTDGDLAPVLEQAPLGLRVADLQRLVGRPVDSLDLAAGPVLSVHVALPKDALRIGDIVILRRHRDALRDAALAALGKFHGDLPDEPGADISRLRRMAWPTLDDDLLRALVDDMLRDGDVQRNGPWLHLPGHSAALSDEDEALAQRLLPDLLAGAYDPPWVRDLARRHNQPEERVRSLLRKLMRRGEVSQIVKDLFYHRDRVKELVALLARLAGREDAPAPSAIPESAAAHEPAAVVDAPDASSTPPPPRGIEAADFRDATGLGRKRAIQILEFFDRVGYTRRVRDTHIPRADAQWDL
ncbi:SelB C-terminal domain-containing protein [Bordetella sp. N]|uniref:selenocysteine-specific translation elongation factor n=1 Tax=Bordetella sp. N TaxID=1746199 RepID=UPI00070964D4|nr:SelB C-terminal domain-containing protein [Bordetella sp. N]ALM85153.1 translation elongation factor [Bordetella sp. N]